MVRKFEFTYEMEDGSEVTVKAVMEPPDREVGPLHWHGDVSAFTLDGVPVELTENESDLIHHEASERCLRGE